MKNLERDYVWECDYGERTPLIPVINRILDEQTAHQLQMVAMFVNDNPYGLELFIAFSYDDPESGQVEVMMEAMYNVGARYRPDITYHELFEEIGHKRFNLTTFVNSKMVDLQFEHLFFHHEKKDIAERISMRPLGKNLPAFLSHAARDKPEVEELISYFNAIDLPVWFDKFNIDYGQSIVDAIQKGVETSGAAIFWVTKSFFNSHGCKTEMRNFLNRYSSGHNILMITVVSEEVSHDDLPMFLRDLKYLRHEKGMTVSGIAKEITPSLKRHFNLR